MHKGSHDEPLKSLLELSCGELQQERLRLDLTSAHGLYAELIYSYLKGDLAGLEQALEKLESLEDSQARAATRVGRLRRQIRSHSLSATEISALEKVEWPSLIWQSEALFVCGIAWNALKEPARAKLSYRQASALFQSCGAPRKGVKALLNYVVAESRERPEGRYIPDYFHIVQKAKALGENGVAGTALLNISREYQKLGALVPALKACDEALELLASDFGSAQYDHARVHRCHLLVDLGRMPEAYVEYERAKASPYAEIRSALEVLEVLLQKAQASQKDLSELVLSPTWRERIGDPREGEREKLTQLEARLLELISQKPREKFELIDLLYSDDRGASIELLDDRFKNILTRLRKKRPQLIVLESGKYRISDEAFLGRGA